MDRANVGAKAGRIGVIRDRDKDFDVIRRTTAFKLCFSLARRVLDKLRMKEGL